MTRVLSTVLVLLTEHFADPWVAAAHHICSRSQEHSSLAPVLQYYDHHSWPNQGEPKLMPISTKEKMSIHEGCILWGSRVVVPWQGWEMVRHERHPDFRRIKELARIYVWWTGIDSDTEECVCTIFSSALTTCYTN